MRGCFRHIERLVQIVDMSLAISARAQRAAALSHVTGWPMELVYLGSVGPTAAEILPFFKSGRPPVDRTFRYTIGQLDDQGVLRCTEGRYIAQTDAWQYDTFQRGRVDGDYWIRESDYRNALAAISQRALIAASKPRN